MAESSRVTRLQESSWSAVPGLTQEQARALETLGSELAAGDEDDPDRSTSLIQCRYTTNGVWEVRVADAIGVVGAGGDSWVVDPKIDPEHLFYLLQRGAVLPSSSTQVAELASGKSFWPLLFDWFLRATETVIRRDLAKGYARESRRLPYIRGTVDYLTLSRGLLRGKTRVLCTYEEFSADIPVNRLLKSGLLLGLRSGLLETEPALRARRLLARLVDVSEADAGDLRVTVDRQTRRYADAVLLAQHILRGRRRELSIGETRAWCFLWRTSQAVENGVRCILEEGLADKVTVSKQTRSYPPLSFTPDLKFDELAIGDVKYVLDSGGWRRSDVYQLLAFTVAHNSKRALLVNFSGGPSEPASVQVSGTAMKRISWQLALAPADAALRLTADVNDWFATEPRLQGDASSRTGNGDSLLESAR
jgi:5-methylcytosine-specific restriction enzyme subunit McrC